AERHLLLPEHHRLAEDARLHAGRAQVGYGREPIRARANHHYVGGLLAHRLPRRNGFKSRAGARDRAPAPFPATRAAGRRRQTPIAQDGPRATADTRPATGAPAASRAAPWADRSAAAPSARRADRASAARAGRAAVARAGRGSPRPPAARPCAIPTSARSRRAPYSGRRAGRA